MTLELTSAQRLAIEHVAASPPPPALVSRALNHLRRWHRVAVASGVSTEELLTVNFHPDRRARDGMTVLESILQTGRLQNQFESDVTNGFPLDWNGGLRARRESAIFGGAYDTAEPANRPKYGSINLSGNPRGGWPRFGSCHWQLSSRTMPRCTVTVPGSPTTRAWWGLPEGLDKLLLDLDWVPQPEDGHRYRLLDGPVELQIHGEIELGRDVVGLVLDASFRGSATENRARALAGAFGIRLDWAPDLRKSAADWRITAKRRHARERVAGAAAAGDWIDAAWIGRGLWAERTDPEARAIVDGAGRYLWNRLLLTQDTVSPGIERSVQQLEAHRPLAVVNRAARIPNLVAAAAE